MRFLPRITVVAFFVVLAVFPLISQALSCSGQTFRQTATRAFIGYIPFVYPLVFLLTFIFIKLLLRRKAKAKFLIIAVFFWSIAAYVALWFSYTVNSYLITRNSACFLW